MASDVSTGGTTLTYRFHVAHTSTHATTTRVEYHLQLFDLCITPLWVQHFGLDLKQTCEKLREPDPHQDPT